MRGSLSEFTIAELAQLFALSEKSGVIRITHGERCSSLFFEAGRIVGWDSEAFDLSDAVNKCQVLRPATDVLRDITTEDGNIALASIVQSAIDPARWEPFVQRLLESHVYPLLSAEEGDFEVETGRIPAPKVLLNLSVQQLILDGSRWEADLNELAHEGYGVTTIWKRYETIPANPNIELSALDWLIWSHLRLPRNIEDIAESLCFPVLETADAVKSLYLKRVVDRASETDFT